MGQINNLNSSQVPDVLRRQRVLETASPFNSTALDPDELPTTTNSPNLYVDPVTGELYRCI